MASTKKLTLAALITRAEALGKKEIVRLQFDPVQGKRACNTGLKALAKHRALVKKSYPGFEVDAIELLPALCDELLKAQRAARSAAESAGTREQLEAAVTHRRTLLPLAQALAAAGKIDARALAKIERGSGIADNLVDVLELVKLLQPVATEVAAVLGAGGLDRAREEAETALEALGAIGADNRAEGSRRDRIATLVGLLHERLRTAVAACTSYSEAAALVPPLASGRDVSKKPVADVPTPPAE